MNRIDTGLQESHQSGTRLLLLRNSPDLCCASGYHRFVMCSVSCTRT
jgi:hypothetical protein